MTSEPAALTVEPPYGSALDGKIRQAEATYEQYRLEYTIAPDATVMSMTHATKQIKEKTRAFEGV